MYFIKNFNKNVYKYHYILLFCKIRTNIMIIIERCWNNLLFIITVF